MPYVAELTGDAIRWRCAGDYDLRVSALDQEQTVADFRRFGPPDSAIPLPLARDVAQRLGMLGDGEPVWLQLGDEHAVELLEAVTDRDQARIDALRPWANVASPGGDTALILSLYRPVDVLRRLLAIGADPDLARRGGETPLMLACERGLVHHARALLRAGADATRRDARGRTALMTAGYGGRRACAELVWRQLDAQHVEVTPEDIEAALIGRLPDLAEAMASVAAAPASPELLFAAVRGGSFSLLTLALDAGIAPDTREVGDFEITPLIAAVQIPAREEFVAALIDRGADVDATDNEGSPALVWACRRAYRSMLLAAGADPDGRDHGRPGPTLLYRLCAERAHLADIRMLLDAGADVNAAQPGNKTPLHCAAGNGDVAVVKLLLKHGADPTVVDCYGHTPSWWASSDEVRMLLDAGSD